MKKGYSIVLSSTDSTTSRHFFLSRTFFLVLCFLALVIVIVAILGFFKYGTVSYRLIELAIVKRRNTEMEKEFSKLEALKKKLELAERENQKIRMMLGIDKTPEEVAPSTEQTEHKYLNELTSLENAANLPYLAPAIGQISRKFSPEHKGIDIAGTLYSPVIAAADGKVVSVSKDTLYGNMVVIEHNTNYRTMYGHLDSIYVKPGDAVTAGKIIGTLGSTGRSTSPHLHYEVIFQGQPVDPMVYLPARVDAKGGL